MKKIMICCASLLLLLTGCNNFLNSEDLTSRDTSNYPENEGEFNSSLAGIYAAARVMEIDPNGASSFIVSEILSDDRFTGGGPDDIATFGQLEKLQPANTPNFFEATWSNAYKAIYRANSLLKSAATFKWPDETVRDDIEGQAYFLRAYSYFYLARLFGTAPLVLGVDPVNLPRASADQLFGQIAADLQTAVSKLPNTPKVAERGRASRWAAEALLARAYLFYSGYYKKENITLPDGKTSVTKADVISALDDVVANSGYSLTPDFRNLWPYSNELSKRDGYPYSIDNKLAWVGEKGGNNETLFAFQSQANVPNDEIYNYLPNRIDLYFSIREQDEAGIFPFGKGWGFGTVNSELWNSWPDNDPRKKGSIIDVADKKEMSNFKFGADHQQDETGFVQKKYIAVNVKTKDSDGNPAFVNYSKEAYGDEVNSDYQLNNTQDLVIIRFADVLLMDAELKRDVAPINLVRARAGLPPVAAYSDNVLRNERRWEFAFEGLRYFDLLRWGIAGQALAAKNGVEIMNANAPTRKNVGDIASRIKATGGFMAIPQAQIDLSNKVLTQTPGWTSGGN